MSSAWALLPASLGVPKEKEGVNWPAEDKALLGPSWSLSGGLDPSQPHLSVVLTSLSPPSLAWPWPQAVGVSSAT